MITVALTALENKALELAGNAPDSDVKSIISLQMTAQGVNDVDAEVLTQAALSARHKIAQATAYTIVIEEPGVSDNA